MKGGGMPVGEPNGLIKGGVVRDVSIGACGHWRLVQPGALQVPNDPAEMREPGV